MTRRLTLLALLLTASPAAAHYWYGGLRTPDTGEPCCGNDDCAPYPHRMNPAETKIELLINGTWWPVPADKILLDQVSPDYQVHACCYAGIPAPGGKKGCEAMDPPAFRCVVALGGAT